jgi:hypothetical protein
MQPITLPRWEYKGKISVKKNIRQNSCRIQNKIRILKQLKVGSGSKKNIPDPLHCPPPPPHFLVSSQILYMGQAFHQPELRRCNYSATCFTKAAILLLVHGDGNSQQAMAKVSLYLVTGL